MSISELRDEIQQQLAGFLWDAWAQMGVAATPRHRDLRAADPEALLLVTFEVGRREPRLFDEVLDWMLVNERLVSVQRLRNLSADDADSELTEAALGWLGQNRRRPRLGAKQQTLWADREPQPFFRNSQLKVADPDPAFLAQGFLKPRAGPSGKSEAPDLRLPINLSFRLRLLLGVSVRAEVIRVLLTTDAPWMNAQALAATSAYTKRNVQEALASLAADGFVSYSTVGNENRYEIPRDRWANFLQTDRIPVSVEWPQVFRTFRRILRWLEEFAGQDLSDYMFSSQARTLLEELRPDLLLVGVPINVVEATQDFPSFERFVRGLLKSSV